MKNTSNYRMIILTACTLLICLLVTHSISAKDNKPYCKTHTTWNKGADRNLFLEAGYSKADINRKVEKAYYDLFEGTNPIYFEVGNSMGYLSGQWSAGSGFVWLRYIVASNKKL